MTGVTSPAATYDAATDVCEFAVAEAHFTVTHTGAGSISAVSVDLVYTDAIGAEGAQWNTNAGTGVVPSVDPNSLRQKFSVTFVKSGSAAVPKSGSPGYVVGAPLLAGTVTVDPAASSAKEAVSRLVDGLPVPAAGLDGHCGANYKSPVRFGVSQSSSCAVPLTLSGLQAFCEGTGSSGSVDAYMNVIATTSAADGVAPTAGAPLPAQLTDGLFYSVATASLSLSAATAVVAGWADASYLNVADWRACSATDDSDCATEIAALGAPAESMSWDASTNTCSNVVVGINLDVLTAKVGTMDNPQSRVSRVSPEWKYDSWTHADPYASSSTRQDFMLTSTARLWRGGAGIRGGDAGDAPHLPFPTRGRVLPVCQRGSGGWKGGGIRVLVVRGGGRARRGVGDDEARVLSAECSNTSIVQSIGKTTPIPLRAYHPGRAKRCCCR